MDKNKLKRGYSILSDALKQAAREAGEEVIADEILDERENNIAKATIAMLDAGLSDETIIQMIQKYWDLPRSQTLPFIEWAHKQLE